MTTESTRAAKDGQRPVARFEDLIAWQKARAMTKRIRRVAKAKFGRDFKLRDQIGDAAGSSMANLAEGWRRYTPCERQHFYNTAKSSAGEVQSHLYIALDDGYITQDEFQELYDQADEVCRLIQGLRTDAERKCTAEREGKGKRRQIEG